MTCPMTRCPAWCAAPKILNTCPEVPARCGSCPTAYLVKLKLTTVRSRDGSVSTFTSDPVDQLLRGAARHYPEFAGLIEPAA